MSRFHAYRAEKRTRNRKRLSLAALALAIGVPAFAAPSEWKSLPSFAEPEIEDVTPMGFEIPGESFPGSAFYYLEDVPYFPDEPDVAATASTTVTDPLAGPVARALAITGTGQDRSRALQCMTMAIYYEAASESDAGQRAVAQVVMNRLAHPTYPNTVCGVVFQGSERSTGCQFSFTCDGSLARQPSRRFWNRAEQVADAALYGAVYRPVGLATHYHTNEVHPYWADSLNHVGTIGAHRFYRWKGAAGLPAAFSARYAGAEPLPAPHPRSTAASTPAPDPVELARNFEQSHASLPVAPSRSTATGTPPPDYTPQVRARGGDTSFSGSRLPQSGDVRQEYTRAGQWLDQP